jgi:lipoic acid synthetase
MGGPLRVRWLGRVPYGEALALQRALFGGAEQHLLLLEHPRVFTYGAGADLARNVLVDPAESGTELVRADRGGDVTYHGPGQLVGYPILSLTPKHGTATGMADTVAYVRSVEQLVIDALAELGLPGAGRLRGYPGVWIDPDGSHPRKICAIGVRLTRGRTMHGFALNVTTDLGYLRRHIVPCGIADKGVTSLAEEGVHVTMRDVVDVVARLAGERWGGEGVERQDVAWQHDPVEDGIALTEAKPEWLRPRVRLDTEVLKVRRTLRDLSLVTVCEEAGCPNLSECWADGTATLMVLGERCTRACGFCLVDTRRPAPPDEGEPVRVADAVERMGLSHAVLTMVARDDLSDGGMAHVAACVAAIRARCPDTTIETLVSDAKGDAASLRTLLDARPDVVNHNVETVPRLQRRVRPSAGYARSLSVLARARAEDLTTKSGLVVGLGEQVDEVDGVLADLAAIGTSVVTIGQYLRPTAEHLPVARWIEPWEFERWADLGRSLGLAHVEASPLTRSSYHAREGAERAVAVRERV